MRIIGNDPSTPRQAQIVASGTLPSGQPVVVNADGTVSVVAQQSSSAGAAETFDAGSIGRNAVVHDTTNNKIIIAYGEGNSQGLAVVGTVDASAKTISFGTSVQFDSGNADHIAIGFDAALGKCLISYSDGNNSNYGTTVVGTVSGTSISFGTPQVFLSDSAIRNSVAYDADAGKFLLACANQSNGYNGTAFVATIDNTYNNASVGSQVVFNSNHTRFINAVYDPDQGQVGLFYRTDSSDYGVYKLGTISGTSVSFTSEQTFKSSTMGSIGATYDTANDKFVVAYSQSGISNRGFVNTGTSDGSSISFGTEAEINNPYESIIVANATVFDESSSRSLILWRNGNGSTSFGLTTIPVNASGSTPAFDAAYELGMGASDESSAAYDSTNSRVIFVANNGGDGEAKVWATTPSNLTANNYIGMSGGAVSVDSQTEEIGSAVVFESADTTENSVVFDSANNKVVIAYEDRGNSNYGTAVVGTVSGTSISFGTPVVFESAESRNISATFDSSNNKVVIAYDDNGNSSYGTAVVGTVSGTSISFGSPVVFESAGVDNIGATFDSSNNKVVIAYEDNGNSNYGTAIVGTVSGTSISFGSPAVFESSQAQRINSTFDSNSNKVVIAYRTTTGKAAVGTVSGTSISFGTPVEFYNATTEVIDIVFDSNVNKVVIAYQSSANDAGLAKVGTVSGTSISFGAEATFNDSNVSAISPAFDSSINKVVIAYEDKGNSDYGTYVVGTVSDTSISFGTSSVFDSVNIAGSMGATFDSANNKVVTAYRDGDNSNYGTSVVLQAGYTNITRGSVADGDNAAINLKGAVAENQVGLTAGQSYYVQTDGTLGTTPADPSVFAGTAVAATKLIVKG